MTDHQDFGERAYRMKSPEISWLLIGYMLMPSSKNQSAWARSNAKRYAESRSLPFPKPECNMPAGIKCLPTTWNPTSEKLAKRALLHRMDPYS